MGLLYDAGRDETVGRGAEGDGDVITRVDGPAVEGSKRLSHPLAVLPFREAEGENKRGRRRVGGGGVTSCRLDFFAIDDSISSCWAVLGPGRGIRQPPREGSGGGEEGRGGKTVTLKFLGTAYICV